MSKKDFGDIFKTNTADKFKKNIIKNDSDSVIIRINPGDCVNWKYSDRSDFELGDLEYLAQDIKRNGQVQPILVRKIKNGKYEIIAGERRWKACLLLGTDVMAVEIEQDDLSAFMSQHSENNKESISPYSRSKSYFKLLNDKVISQNALASKLNIKKSTFSELMSFTSVPDELWKAIGDMSNVSISTASYIRKILNENPNNLKRLIEISNKIKHGAGKGTIKKLLENNEKDSVNVIKDANGKILMKAREQSIEFSDTALNVKTMNEIISFIRDYLFNDLK